MVEPSGNPETKGSILEMEKSSRDTIMQDLMAGRISPTQAAATLGLDIAELNNEVQMDIKERRTKAKEKPEEEAYLGIPISKPVTQLTEEEFRKILAPSPTEMKGRNTQLAHFEDDPRFFAPLKEGEVGYQPGLPDERQSVHTDFEAVREYLKTGKLTAPGQEIKNAAGGLREIDPGITKDESIRSAYQVLQAINAGKLSRGETIQESGQGQAAEAQGTHRHRVACPLFFRTRFLLSGRPPGPDRLAADALGDDEYAVGPISDGKIQTFGGAPFRPIDVLVSDPIPYRGRK